jgi:type IV pilus assembly protein PilB
LALRSRSHTAAIQAGPERDAQARISDLGTALVKEQIVTSAQLAQALATQPLNESALIDALAKQAVSPVDLSRGWAALHGLPMVDLRQVTPDAETTAKLDERHIRSLRALPYRHDADGMQVAIVDPSVSSRAAVSAVISGPVVFHVAPAADVLEAVDRLFRADAEIDTLAKAVAASDVQRSTAMAARDAESDDDAPIVQIANRVIAQGMRDRASDVHIEPLEDTIRVRFRIDGTLVDVFSLPLSILPALVSRFKIMAGMNIVERRRPQDGQFSTTVDGRDLDVRVSTVATVMGEKVVARLLDKSRSALALSQLGMPPDTNDEWAKLVHAPFGMVVCAGPTGAGKTTTLYATLREINSTGKNVMTIEDPVEYIFPGINQIQTNEAAGVTFAKGLKAILRQDPDVILVGEVRDADTARIAVQSALTGHLVLSSLHGTDSVAALHRMLDMGIESFLIASAVVGIVGQRLLRRICGACKEVYQPPPEEIAMYVAEGGTAKSQYWHGAGCAFCAGTGYRDRIGVYELLKLTPELRRLIVGWATQEELRRLAVNQGMRTLMQEAIGLVEADVTTIHEVIRTLHGN